ncbi:MAG: TraR/DksA C4-type zinc finger protein [bacterium]|nr:TraR/DksA C4-type zinc finger protein [bacterium]
MDKDTKEQLKQKLVNEKHKIRELLEKMTNQKEFNKDKIQVTWNDMGDKEEDNAVEVANFQDNISLERDLEVNLEKIDNALEKIDNDDFGKCIKCGNDIKIERLIAYPEAEVCMSCASKKRK